MHEHFSGFIRKTEFGKIDVMGINICTGMHEKYGRSSRFSGHKNMALEKVDKDIHCIGKRGGVFLYNRLRSMVKKADLALIGTFGLYHTVKSSWGQA